MSEAPPSSAGSSSPPASSETPTGLSLRAPKDVLAEDFRQQCTNLQNQYTRMHGRMQLITGLNTALLPTLGALAVAASRDDVGYGWLLLFPAAGMLLSAIGYVAGANDRHLVGPGGEQPSGVERCHRSQGCVRDLGSRRPQSSRGRGHCREAEELVDILALGPRVGHTPSGAPVARLLLCLAPGGSHPARSSASPEHLTSPLSLTVSLGMRKRW
jgi:hypothetical protein